MTCSHKPVDGVWTLTITSPGGSTLDTVVHPGMFESHSPGAAIPLLRNAVWELALEVLLEDQRNE